MGIAREAHADVTGSVAAMSDRFESYLRQAADLVRDGDLSRAEGFERLARQTLGSPARLGARLHDRGRRALRRPTTLGRGNRHLICSRRYVAPCSLT